MKGIDDLLWSASGTTDTIYEQLAFPLFDYSTMTRKAYLRGTLLQYLPELLALLGHIHISDDQGSTITEHIWQSYARAGSDRSVTYGTGGHVFYISD